MSCRRSSRVVRASVAVLLAVTVNVFLPAASAQDAHPASPPPARLLEVGKAVERTVEPRPKSDTRPVEADSWAVELTSGQAAEISLRANGLDLGVSVLGPDGKKLAAPFKIDRFDSTPIAVIATEPGKYVVQVTARATGAAETYEIEVTSVGPASKRQRDLVEAARLEKSALEQAPTNPLAGRSEKAIEEYERVLAIRESALGSDHTFVAVTLRELSFLKWTGGDRDEAEVLASRAVAILEKAHKPEDLALASPLESLATLIDAGGDTIRALQLRERVLVIQEKNLGPDHPDVNTTLLSLLVGLSRVPFGAADRSVEKYVRRFVELREKLFGPSSVEVAQALMFAGAFYATRPEHIDEAIRMLERSDAIHTERLGPDSLELAFGVSLLAELLDVTGEAAKAGVLWARVDAILDKNADSSSFLLPLSVMNRARCLREKGELAIAVALLEKLLERFKGTPIGFAQLLAGPSLAELYRVMGDPEKSEQIYLDLLSIPAIAMYSMSAQMYQRQLSVACRAKGDLAGAVAHQARCNELRERDVVRSLTSGSAQQRQIHFGAGSSDALNCTVSLNVQAAPTDPAASRLGLEAVLRAKGRALDAMADSIGILRRRSTGEDQALLKELAAAQSRLSNASTSGLLDTTAMAALEDRVAELEQKISARSSEFRARFQPVTLGAVQKAIPRDAALVEFALYQPVDMKAVKVSAFLGPARYAAYVMTQSGQPRVADLGNAAAIDELATKMRTASADPGRRDAKTLARQLDELVMRPVRSLLGAETHLLVAPDGQLNLVPIAALIDERDRYLVEQFHITYLSSGRVLLGLQIAGDAVTPAVVVADPDFGSASPESAAASRDIVHETAELSTAMTFAPLPGTASEAAAIGKIVPGARILARSAATELAVKQLVRPRILHVATHGFFLPDAKPAAPTPVSEALVRAGIQAPPTGVNPLVRSGLALSGANSRLSGNEDGLLTAAEVAGIDLFGTRLVVLSACKTGVGDVRTGDGVYGLRRALVLAGSESQVMTLWSVSDRAMSDLMVAFYRNLKRGDGRSDALRHVQLEMLRSKDRAHPFYWAGVIQSGAWTPISDWR